MSSTLEASVFMGKNYSENSEMFDISEKSIVGQSDEIYGVSPMNWEDSPCKKNISLVSAEEVISLSHAKVYFSDSVLCLGMVSQNPTSNTAWEEKLSWFKSSSQYRTLWTQMTENRRNSSGISSQDSLHCSSSKKSNSS